VGIALADPGINGSGLDHKDETAFFRLVRVERNLSGKVAELAPDSGIGVPDLEVEIGMVRVYIPLEPFSLAGNGGQEKEQENKCFFHGILLCPE
jgi:hypothetical protein